MADIRYLPKRLKMESRRISASIQPNGLLSFLETFDSDGITPKITTPGMWIAMTQLGFVHINLPVRGVFLVTTTENIIDAGKRAWLKRLLSKLA